MMRMAHATAPNDATASGGAGVGFGCFGAGCAAGAWNPAWGIPSESRRRSIQEPAQEATRSRAR